MSQPGRAILLAIGGGIAAYKSAHLCSRLAQGGYEVRVAMTRAATEFVGAATLAALAGKRSPSICLISVIRFGTHIELLQQTDLMIVAPATANLLSQFAHGGADDLVSTLYLQAECPILLAPP